MVSGAVTKSVPSQDLIVVTQERVDEVFADVSATDFGEFKAEEAGWLETHSVIMDGLRRGLFESVIRTGDPDDADRALVGFFIANRLLRVSLGDQPLPTVTEIDLQAIFPHFAINNSRHPLAIISAKKVEDDFQAVYSEHAPLMDFVYEKLQKKYARIGAKVCLLPYKQAVAMPEIAG